MRDLYPIGYSQHTVTTSAVTSLDETLIVQSVENVVITIENFNIRYRVDGSNPTSNTGHLVANGLYLSFDDAKSIRNFRCIAIGGNATLCVTYYAARR